MTGDGKPPSNRKSRRTAKHKLKRQLAVMDAKRRHLGGVDNSTHHLLSIKRPPLSLQVLREELLLPQHRDIYNAAAKEKTFETALGQIAAMLDIGLDGEYDPDDICSLLITALRHRSRVGASPASMDSRLVAVDLVERAGSVTLDFAGAFFDPALLPQPSMDGFGAWMAEQGCRVCEARLACLAAQECLGKAALDEGIKKAEKVTKFMERSD